MQDKMGTLRKLQTEIDKTSKKVQEGLGIFDDFWDQVSIYTSYNNKHQIIIHAITGHY
jgi:hypothetical protein